MFKALILQASHRLSDERTEYLIKDRLSFMRFLDLGLGDAVPDANPIWSFREALTRAKIQGKPAIEILFQRIDAALAATGFHWQAIPLQPGKKPSGATTRFQADPLDGKPGRR